MSVFVRGRLIADNIISSYEYLHFMKRTRSKNNRFCALKLGMMKACDGVEWSYLHSIMDKLGFAHSWISTIMGMASRDSFLVLLSGCKIEQFKPSGELSQGDPVCPYLV